MLILFITGDPVDILILVFSLFYFVQLMLFPSKTSWHSFSGVTKFSLKILAKIRKCI